jgi:hypothetical protein
MRKTMLWWGILLGALLLACSPFALAQKKATGLELDEATPGPGWKACPRCINAAHIADDRAKAHVDTRPFDVHDISGVWGDNGIELDVKALPPLTPEGQKLYDATLTTVPGVNSKDPMNICDPLGYPRAFAYNYGMEFIQLPDRVLQFFEFQHTYRTIWTDGRKLPTDPPLDRYFGYSVGRWEGDTFAVESSGFDTRSWLTEDRRKRIHGFRHSSDLRVEERYKRLNYGLLQATLTITDPKVFMKPWVTTGTITLRPNSELSEYFCVPSEEERFNSFSTLPTAGTSKKTLGPDAR